MMKFKQTKRCKVRNCIRILRGNNKSGLCSSHYYDLVEMNKRLKSPTYPEIKKSGIRKIIKEKYP